MRRCHLCDSPEENKYCTNESCFEYTRYEDEPEPDPDQEKSTKEIIQEVTLGVFTIALGIIVIFGFMLVFPD